MTDFLKDTRARLAGFVNAKPSSGLLGPLGLLSFGHLLGRLRPRFWFSAISPWSLQ